MTQLLIVPSTSAASGVVTYVAAQADALRELDPIVLCEPGSDLAALLPAGCRTAPVGPGTGGMARAIAGHRGSVVHTHGPRALLAARRARVPRRQIHHCFHEHPWRSGRRGPGELALSLGTSRLANAPALARRLSPPGLAATVVLPPILPRTVPRTRDDARAALGLAGDAVAVGVIGRLDPVKAPVLAVEAVAALPPLFCERAVLVFIGDGPERGRIEATAHGLGVRALLAGRVPDAAALLPAFDALAVPGRHETFGLVTVEALALGVRVAAVTSPGGRWIYGEASGALAEPTAAGLAATLERTLTAPDAVPTPAAIRDRFGVQAAEQHRAYFARVLGQPLANAPV